VAANLFLKHFGPYGLWFSSFFLIPFDFICRCIFHENKQFKLLVALVLLAALLTVLINANALKIAFASVLGFTAAQLTAGTFYQLVINRSKFVKINGSDLVAIAFDSLVFQFVAFSFFNYKVALGQIAVKLAGGLLWYFVIFKIFKYELNRG
jgi:hypothetical protein